MAETHGFMIVLLIFLKNLLLANSKALLPDANVTCIIPEDCILPCSFRPTGTVVIHWYKQQIPVHSYYYNKDQFGLQNKHFSGRTCLFNSHIPHGNASLLLRRVKVQDKGRYKCYTSTRKGNQEIFVNLEVKALIQSVNMEMTDEMVTCSSHNIYPLPQVTWATDPPSAQEALENSIIKTTDHKGLFTVESTLRILGNVSNYTYFCSFIAADKTQVWTASGKNQESITQEEGHALSIPCIAPHSPQNFSLTWTFTSSIEPTVILRYDTKTRHTFDLWEGQAELDQDLLLLGDGSLLLHKPDIEEHSGTYTCTFSGLQSRHVVQTHVNITVASINVDEQSVQRSWWSTAASAALFLFTITVILLQCARKKAMETRSASHRYNGVSFVVGGIHKGVNTSASYIIEEHGVECNSAQLQFEAQDEVTGSTPNTAEDCAVASPPGTEIEQEEKPVGPPAEGNDGSQSSSQERDGFGNTEPGLHTS
ncbi:HERV-H LTR-associating protein 2 [Epinephelus fuscoguttatus]|uniref:HERV-H LTR-associating protein 2 n=1 Tax=Epinephelus fuscoguttatus TaxID=293821 RepID=UPI0020D1938B|nr:HERV-H LTR-associating protein 2 [Epinephelus fuscoguttatus]